MLTIISTALIAVLVVGLVVSRYYIRRKKGVNDVSFNVSKYWRRQLASTSCDNISSLSTTNNERSHQVINETSGILKSSFSWPETSLLHREEFESSSSLSTIEHLIEPTSLTFGLRWDELTKSLFVRVVSARDLFIHRHNRQPSVIDSYVRTELLSTSTENNTQGN